MSESRKEQTDWLSTTARDVLDSEKQWTTFFLGFVEQQITKFADISRKLKKYRRFVSNLMFFDLHSRDLRFFNIYVCMSNQKSWLYHCLELYNSSAMCHLQCIAVCSLLRFTCKQLWTARDLGRMYRNVAIWQRRSESKCRPGSTIKVPPFQPLKLAYKILQWKKIMFRASLKI